MLSIFDYIIVAIIGFSAIISIFRGFVRELLSVITWVAACVVAWQFGKELSLLIAPYIHNAALRYPVAFIGLFVITMILGGLLNFLLGQLVDKTGLSGTDRVLGLLFGILRGILIIGVMLMLMRLTPAPQQIWWTQSRLVPTFAPLELWLRSFLPQDQQNNFVMRNTI